MWFWLAAVAMAGFALAGCTGATVASGVQPAVPVLRTTFSSDTRGIQTELFIPQGAYRLEVTCDAGKVSVSMNVDKQAVKVVDAVCGRVHFEEFELAQTEPAEVSLTVDTSSATGEARLFKLR